MSDSHHLHLISGAKELSLEVNTLDYLPYGTTTLKLRFEPSKDYAKGTLIAAPRQRYADAERVIVGHEDNGNDFWITWGGGKVDGIHFDPSKGQGYLYFNLCHRSTLLKEAYPVTIEVKDKRGNLIAERRFVLKRPAVQQPIRLAWQSDWPAGSKLIWQGQEVPSYQSRWWPTQELTYTSRQIPNFVLRYDRLVSDNKWGRVTLWLDDPALGGQPLARVDGRLEVALHDVRLFDADLFHFYGDVWAIRLWFSWLHNSFTSQDIHPDLAGQAMPLVRKSRGERRASFGEEIPDAERFDFLIDVNHKMVTHIGTDNHYQELWGEWWQEEAVQTRIGHKKSLRTAFFILSTRLSDTLVSLTTSRADDYNPVAIIREEMESGSRAMKLEEILDALSWESHPPIVDDFRVPSAFIGPDVRLVTDR
jgi:hypothetical protein